LAAVGTLFGMRPAPVANCRVLEIGCGDGSNVVPLAYGLPESHVTGVDLASAPIAAAQRMAGDLELANIRLAPADLRGIGPDYGEFDYIIAHGVYSWVAPEVRDALLRVCSERLAPQGIALVSYNAYPGRHMRQMLREMMLYHTRETADPARRVERARSFLHTIAEGRMAPPAWRGLLQAEAAILLEKDASSFWHDDLAPVNDPVYFHEFAAHAAVHGLQYLGDAEAHLMFDPHHEADHDAGDAIEREQQLDFLRCRRFRETLLCRREIVLDRDPGAARMAEFRFAAPARRCDGAEVEGLNGVRIAPGHAELEAIVGALGDSYPLPLPFEELVPYGGNREALAEILFALVRSGFATFHVCDFPCEETVTRRPRASRLARWQAARSSVVCSACHTPVQLDASGLRLLLLLDGTRDFAAIAREIGPDGLPESLAWMARMGLLEG
jgi:SAM-dependent methyltransferase/putative intracellular protease/amidase